MKIEIQNWWNSKTWTNKYVKLDLDKTLKTCGKLTICTVLIDGEVVGCVNWDGKDLTISKELVRGMNMEKKLQIAIDNLKSLAYKDLPSILSEQELCLTQSILDQARIRLQNIREKI